MKKIMFNDKYGLTQAVLEGRKTQTRRVVPVSTLRKATMEVKVCGGSIEEKIAEQTPYCFSEDVAIAQSIQTLYNKGEIYFENWDARCKAHKKASWANKMFVKANLMPHRIKITNVRVERLKDISDEDCLKEGVYYHTEPPKHHENDRYSPWSTSVKPYKFESEKYFCSAKYAFRHLIEKVSGKGTWESNPWVFVYDFELVK